MADALGWLFDSGNGAAQANFNRRIGVIAYIDTTGWGSFRDPQGTFNKNVTAVTDYYRKVAKGLQADAARRTRQGYLRPRVQTGRLYSVITDARNIDVDRFGFIVGVESFMASSNAKYWRQIEFGTKGVVPSWIGRMVDREGVPLYGVWDFSVGGGGQNWGISSRYGEGTGQKLHPFSEKKRKEITYGDVRDSIGRRLGKRKPRAPYRRKHIAPKNAFEQAWNAAGITGEVMDQTISLYLKGTGL